MDCDEATMRGLQEIATARADALEAIGRALGMDPRVRARARVAGDAEPFLAALAARGIVEEPPPVLDGTPLTAAQRAALERLKAGRRGER